MCPSCALVTRSPGLCATCRSSLMPAPERVVAGVLVRAAFRHEGAARRLVHRLKYQGVTSAVVPLATRIAAIIAEKGDRPRSLVPVPRAAIRRGLHGVDPAVVLATRLAELIDVPVIGVLHAGWWWPRHAGRGRRRQPPRLYRSARAVPPGSALVDDVVTTGATVEQAIGLIGEVRCVYAATLAGGREPSVSNGTSGPSPGRGAD